MNKTYQSALFAALVLSTSFACLRAEDSVVVELYGSGVHHFYAGDMNAAFQDFSTAVDSGAKDPRIYYFRGMTSMRMGSSFQAEDDFRLGAEYEAADVNKQYNVGKALERIQGSDRLALEKHRSTARAAAFAAKQRERKLRLQATRRDEQRVLRAPAPGAAAPSMKAAPKVGGAVAPPVAAGEEDPFSEPAAEAAPAAAMPDEAEATTSQPAAMVNEAAAGASDPFDDEAGAIPAATPPIAPGPKPGTAPAGDAAPAEADPFGDEAAGAAPGIGPAGAGGIDANGGGGGGAGVGGGPRKVVPASNNDVFGADEPPAKATAKGGPAKKGGVTGVFGKMLKKGAGAMTPKSNPLNGVGLPGIGGGSAPAPAMNPNQAGAPAGFGGPAGAPVEATTDESQAAPGAGPAATDAGGLGANRATPAGGPMSKEDAEEDPFK